VKASSLCTTKSHAKICSRYQLETRLHRSTARRDALQRGRGAFVLYLFWLGAGWFARAELVQCVGCGWRSCAGFVRGSGVSVQDALGMIQVSSFCERDRNMAMPSPLSRHLVARRA
jgi:hypothetical protein